MATTCKFCLLQNNDTVPSCSLIVDALHQIVNFILIKDECDKEHLEKDAKACEDTKLVVEELTKKNKQLLSENAKLNNSLYKSQNRSDTYKKKFLDIQESMIKVHNSNKELRQRNGNELNTQQESTSHVGFPFELQKDDTEERKSVILAPDTCYTEALCSDTKLGIREENVRTKNPNIARTFAKSSTESRPIKHFFKPTKKKIKASFSSHDNVNLIDPDETRLAIQGEPEEENEFSIPASPVLGGTISIGKNNTIDRSAAGEEQGSPSLLKSSKMHLSQSNLKKKESLLNPQAVESKSMISKINNEELKPSFEDHNDSFQIHHKRKKLISPIKPISNLPPTFEEDSQLEREMVEHDLSTSIDELFNKTSGVLPMNTSSVMDIVQDEVERLTEKAFSSHNENPVINEKETLKNQHIASTSKQDLHNSFDIVPKEPTEFKYQSVVRKRNERAKLDATACPQCEAYYSDLPEEERKNAIHNICRHRHEYLPPSTPKHFWDIGIPSTAECKRRGYILEESDLTTQDQAKLKEISNRRRRRRPYQAHFASKQN